MRMTERGANQPPCSQELIITALCTAKMVRCDVTARPSAVGGGRGAIEIVLNKILEIF